VGKSVIVESRNPVKRVSLASSDIADAFVITPRQIYVSGKSPGITNLTLWEDSAIIAIYDVDVLPNVSGLEEKLH